MGVHSSPTGYVGRNAYKAICVKQRMCLTKGQEDRRKRLQGSVKQDKSETVSNSRLCQCELGCVSLSKTFTCGSLRCSCRPKTGLKKVKITINATPDVTWHIFRPSFYCSVSSWGYCRARWRLTMATSVKNVIRQKATRQKLLEKTRHSNQVFSVSRIYFFLNGEGSKH